MEEKPDLTKKENQRFMCEDGFVMTDEDYSETPGILNRPAKGLRKRSDIWKRYFAIGLTAFIVLSMLILLIFLLIQSEKIVNPFDKLMSALAPVFFGMVFAYIVNPLMKFVERKVKLQMLKRKKAPGSPRTARYIAIAITMVLVFLILSFLTYLLVPQLTVTVSGLVLELPGQIDSFTQNFLEWFNGLVVDDSEVGKFIKDNVSNIFGSLEEIVGKLDIKSVSGSIFASLKSVLGTIYNVIIGFIFALYILASKETLAAQIKKVLHAFLKPKTTSSVLRVFDMCHSKFTNAIIGKILDSAIVGVLCFFGMLIFGFPYAALISVVVGVTNVLPFFGPYIGAIPSALLVLFVDPVQCIWFVVFIIVLQQIDANIIDPRIVGSAVDLSAFWVLFACVVFGSLFGVLGLLMGVPLMACIYMLVKDAIERRLESRGEPTETDDYR